MSLVHRVRTPPGAATRLQIKLALRTFSIVATSSKPFHALGLALV
jgi:hypothetical protein